MIWHEGEIDMEYRSKSSKRPNEMSKRAKTDDDMSIFWDFIRKHAQEEDEFITSVDPHALQVGQSIYDLEGHEMVVISDPEGTDEKVLVPKEQVGQQYPAGTVSVTDSDLAVSYSVQPMGPTVARVIRAFSILRRENMGRGMGRGVKECPYNKSTMDKAEDWMTMDDDETNVDNWLDMDRGGCLDDKFKGTLFFMIPEFKKCSHDKSHYRNVLNAFSSSMNAFHDPDDQMNKFKSEFKEKEEDKFRIGDSGYVEVINCINSLVNDGYETVDIILKIGEEFPRDMGERVLSDARMQGIL